MPKVTLAAPRALVLTPQDRDEEWETQGHFVVMILILLLPSAALMGVLLLFDGTALMHTRFPDAPRDTRAAIKELF
jgi:hypothetical protein